MRLNGVFRYGFQSELALLLQEVPNAITIKNIFHDYAYTNWWIGRGGRDAQLDSAIS